MLGTSSTDDELISQYIHWSTILDVNTSPSDLTQDTLPPQSIWITTFLDFIKISAKSSSTGKPPCGDHIYLSSDSQDPYRLPFISRFVGPHINLTGGIFTTLTRLSTSIIYFVNRITDRWASLSFTNADDDYFLGLIHEWADLFPGLIHEWAGPP